MSFNRTVIQCPTCKGGSFEEGKVCSVCFGRKVVDITKVRKVEDYTENGYTIIREVGTENKIRCHQQLDQFCTPNCAMFQVKKSQNNRENFAVCCAVDKIIGGVDVVETQQVQ